MTTRPHRQYIALARLMEILASKSAEALEHLAHERLAIDSWPATTMGNGGSRSADRTTPVERAALAVTDIDAKMAQIIDDMRAVASVASSAMVVINDALGYRVPASERKTSDVRLCNPSGREGHLVEYTPYSRDPQNGWADPTCVMPAARGALCEACYVRERRWRITNGYPMLADFVAAAS